MAVALSYIEEGRWVSRSKLGVKAIEETIA